MIKGRILNVSGRTLSLARGAKIYRSYDEGNNWFIWIKLPIAPWKRVAMEIPLLARLFRFGIHHLVFSGNKAIVIVNKESFLIENNQVKSLGILNGSRPMSLYSNGDAVYYGEYRSNHERSPVHIWKLDFYACKWKAVWSFDTVRHVHGVFHDPFTDAVWVTTGDTDSEAAIWCTNDSFSTLKYVLGGSQQFRAVQLLFTLKYIYFGSDAPGESNYIYRITRSNYRVETLESVGGSVFYGCQIGEHMFFSTAVEPSKVNSTIFTELWYSNTGNQWHKVKVLKKDFLSMKYFQYGQILFPSGSSFRKSLYYSPFATEKHGNTLKIDLNENADRQSL